MTGPFADSGGSGSQRRACDQCRARKIRCDKGPGAAPCANCRAVNRECRWTNAGQKGKEAKHRVLISHQYERKIDTFEARLSGIEGMLQGLVTSMTKEGPSDGTDPKTYTSPSVLSDTNTVLAEPLSTRLSPPSATPLQDAAVPDDSLADDSASFQGKSSMTAQAAFASDFLEHAVTGTPLMDRAAQPDMHDALAALRAMAQQQQQPGRGRGRGLSADARRSLPQKRRLSQHFARRKPLPRGGIAQLPLPPTDVVLLMLREIRGTPSVALMTSCSFLDVDNFVAACRDVYFATEDFGLARFVIANAGLYYLFEERVAIASSTLSRDTFLQYQGLCADNIETALANLPFFIPPSGDMVEALLLGVAHAVEHSKFTLAWQLNSAAAAMCQTLGWHHYQDDSPDSVDNPDALRPAPFWYCYMIDKGLAIRFGRSCVLPDWDISTPRDVFYNKKDKDVSSHNASGHSGQPQAAVPNPQRSIGRVFNVWIRTGSILGQTYEHLYSPAALDRSPRERSATARQLVAAAQLAWREFEQIMPTVADAPVGTNNIGGDDAERRHAIVHRVLLSGHVGHLSTLTLIYRAMPSAAEEDAGVDEAGKNAADTGALRPECIAAARGAFRSHQNCMAMAADEPMAQAGYLHWTILYAPFTPLIVLFCHVIETARRESGGSETATTAPSSPISSDLGLLDAFAASLYPLRALSPAVARMYGLSRLLHQIAVLYVDAKGREGGGATMEKSSGGVGENLAPVSASASDMHIDDAVPLAVGTADLDVYLSQLGFLANPNVAAATTAKTVDASLLSSPDAGAMTDGPATTTGDVLSVNPAVTTAGEQLLPSSGAAPAGLEDWFSGNTYVMGLLEDDTLDFGWDPSVNGSL